MICLNCEGWGCAQCKSERDAAKGGEQGLSPLEIEVAQLRADHDAWQKRALKAEDDLTLLAAELVLLRSVNEVNRG